jgi:hypothetical protein
VRRKKPFVGRHGFNVPVLSDPSLAREVEAVARKISGPHADDETLEWAQRILASRWQSRLRPSSAYASPRAL